MTLNQMIYFQTVARLENFRAAAEKLYISQPSLSRAMSSLEDELEIELFVKEGRGVKLTTAGKIFEEHVSRILEDYDAAVSDMTALSTVGGRINIGYGSHLANYYIPHMVRQFLNIEDNRNVKFGFFQECTADIISDITTGKLDIGFVGYTENNDNLEFLPIIKQDMVIITSPNHPLAKEDSLSKKTLLDYPVIGYTKDSALGHFTNKLYKNMHLKPHIIHECLDENAIQALVREDFGIALVAKIDTFNSDLISIHNISDVNINHYVSMVWLKDHYQLPAARRFIDFMLDNSDLSTTVLRTIAHSIDEK